MRIQGTSAPAPASDRWGTVWRKGVSMKYGRIFLVRLLLSIVFSIVFARLFFGSTSVVRVGALAVALLGFAYLFEYTKKRDRGNGDGS